LNGSTGEIDHSGTNATTVIQNAIDALTSGGKILIKAGEYNCDGDIELKDGVCISGEGIPDLGLVNSTVLKGYNISTALLKTTSKISIGIKNLAIWIDKSTSNANADAINVTLNDRSYIGHIVINSTPRNGLTLGSGSGVSIVEFIRVDNNDENAVVLSHCADMVVRFIDAVAGTSGRGLLITGGSHLRIYSCNLYNCYMGISVDYATDVDLIGCRGNNNDYMGIRIGTEAKGIRIIGGSAYGNSGNGYVIESSAEDISIISAKSYNNVNGFRITDGSKINLVDCSAWDDQTTHTQYRGINITGGDNITIQDFKSLGGHIYNDIGLLGGSNINVLGGHFTSVKNDIGATIKDVIGYTTENSGTAIFSGDGSTTSFDIPHGLAATPTNVRVSSASPDAEGVYSSRYDADATNIVAKFKTAPSAPTVEDSNSGNINGTSSTISDDDKSWTDDEWIGHYVRITGGTGSGQCRRIIDNDATILTISPDWDTIPDNTSVYDIIDSAIEIEWEAEV